MKKYLTLLFLIVAIGSKAQNLVTVTSVFDGKTIAKPLGGIETQPVAIGATTDTVRSYIYDVTFSRDTTATVTINAYAYDKTGTQLYQRRLVLTASTYKKWKSLITPIDAFILIQLKRLSQLTQ